MPTLARTASPVRTSTTTPRPTTPASRSPSPAPRPCTARWSPTTRRCAGLAKDADRVVGARVDADGRELVVRARVVVNATGVWSDDVRALDEGTHPASIRPAKGIHITVPWSKVRNDIAAVVPVPKDRRSVFVVPWGDTTYIGTTDTDYDGPLDDPQCTPADVDYLLAAINAVDRRAAHRVRRPRHVGRPAAPRCARATATRTADLSRRHSVRTVAERRGHRHRRQAHDLPAHGGRHGRRRARGPRRARPPVADEAPAPARRRGTGTAGRGAGAERARAPRRPLRHRGRGGARPRRRRSRPRRSRSSPACPTCAPRPSTRSATRWHARSTTCSSRAPGPGSWPATPRRPRPTTSPTSSRPTSAGRSEERDAQVAGYRAAIATERRAADRSSVDLP